MALFDAYGRPVDTGLLKEEQAAATFSGIRNIYSIMHPSIGITPEKLNAILRQSELGDPYLFLELCEDMEEKDLHYLSVLSTRKQTVAQLDITVKPASSSAEDKMAADLVRDMLVENGDFNVQAALFDILDAIGKGFSATEIIWDQQSTEWAPVALKWRDPRWFMFDWISGNMILVRTLRTDGQGLLRGLEGSLVEYNKGDARIGIQPATEPLAPYKFITHFSKAKSGLPIRGGLSRAASWVYMFKTFIMKDWVTFAERFGMPARVGKYGPGASSGDRELLLRAAAALGSDAAAILPEGMEIEFLEVKSSGGGRSQSIYEQAAVYFDSAMSKAVLGQTLTTEMPGRGGGSRAAAQVHADVRRDILAWDAVRVAESLNRDLVKPIVDLNLGERRRYPLITLGLPDDQDMKVFSDVVGTLVDRGLKVGQRAILDKVGLPAPVQGEAVLQPRTSISEKAPEPDDTNAPDDLLDEAPVQPTPHVRKRTTNRKTRRNRARPDTLAIEAGATRMSEEWELVMGPLVDPLQRSIAQARDLPDVKKRLAEAVPEMNTDDLVERLARAGFAVRAAGRMGARLS